MHVQQVLGAGDVHHGQGGAIPGQARQHLERCGLGSTWLGSNHARCDQLQVLARLALQQQAGCHVEADVAGVQPLPGVNRCVGEQPLWRHPRRCQGIHADEVQGGGLAAAGEHTQVTLNDGAGQPHLRGTRKQAVQPLVEVAMGGAQLQLRTPLYAVGGRIKGLQGAGIDQGDRQ